MEPSSSGRAGAGGDIRGAAAGERRRFPRKKKVRHDRALHLGVQWVRSGVEASGVRDALRWSTAWPVSLNRARWAVGLKFTPLARRRDRHCRRCCRCRRPKQAASCQRSSYGRDTAPGTDDARGRPHAQGQNKKHAPPRHVPNAASIR